MKQKQCFEHLAEFLSRWRDSVTWHAYLHQVSNTTRYCLCNCFLNYWLAFQKYIFYMLNCICIEAKWWKTWTFSSFPVVLFRTSSLLSFFTFPKETLGTDKRPRTFCGGLCTLKPVHAGRDYIFTETISPLTAAARLRCLFTLSAQTKALTTSLFFSHTKVGGTTTAMRPNTEL